MRIARGIFARGRSDRPDEFESNEPTIVGTILSLVVNGITWALLIGVLIAFTLVFVFLATGSLSALMPPQSSEKPPSVNLMLAVVMFCFTVTYAFLVLVAVLAIVDWPFLNSFPEFKPEFDGLHDGVTFQIRMVRSVYSLLGTMFTLGLSLLPLTALIVAIPAVSPNEAVLTPTVTPATSFFRRLARRIAAVASGLIVTLALLAFSVQFVSMLPLPAEGRLAAVSKQLLGIAVYRVDDPKSVYSDYRPGEPKVKPPTFTLAGELTKELKEKKGYSDTTARYLSEPLYKRLPTVMVEHWPFIVLSIYAFDLLLLLAIGKVPLAYNMRSVLVRWRISVLTALAFTVVVALVIVLLAFVNGMYELNDNSGIPGNVIVMSEGSTDEMFSNLGHGDISNIPNAMATLDPNDEPLPAPVGIKKTIGSDGKPSYLVSKEIFYTINQSVPNPTGGAPRRRFLQLRAMDDAHLSGEVHDVELLAGNWFQQSGIQQKAGPDGTMRTYIQAVLGDGAAAMLGEETAKGRLDVGDTFAIGDTDWLVVGIMASSGKTFGSEIWAQNTTLITKPFGKDKYTTLVMRTDPPTEDAARAMAYHLQYRYDQQKLKSFSEKDYFKELTKTNEGFLTNIVIIAVVMAVGGVFGVMNTMFASIAARIKEVGMLRILGFKRWQILISFMLESLAIAFAGGLLGCLLGYLCNGFEATSTLSSGQGGGKRVLLKLTVDYQTIAAGMLFTLMMGRIGGLVPALSAMRMKILDTLR